jgi:5'-nucleotidase
MPHILITNDDGVFAPGLRALVEALRPVGEISVVAPSEERSGAAQSITLKQPIICEPVAEREWAVYGTPADAMILALHRLLPQHPDLVVSGINRGANLGENVYYSGTVGAALEAAINGIPAMAISLAHKGRDFDFGASGRFARRLVELALGEKLPPNLLLNVNVPQKWTGAVRFTRQSEKITRNLLKDGTDPRGRAYYWLHEQTVKNEVAPETDYAAIFAGAVSVTPLELDRTHETSLNHLSHWAKLLES